MPRYQLRAITSRRWKSERGESNYARQRREREKNGPWLSTELRAFAVGWHASMKDEFMLLRGKIHGGPQNGTQKWQKYMQS